mgnify:CR=1 FL=1|tara:strand:- start:354 stop:743 length:390 start_codon:yes stop_codon:yes gene_type:complete
MLSIDHLVLTVSDTQKTIAFYTKILGMNLEGCIPSGEAETRIALCFGAQKINLHPISHPYKPHAEKPLCGSVDICFISNESTHSWTETSTKHSVIIEKGSVQRTGTCEPITSLYLRNSDSNLIEVANQN